MDYDFFDEPNEEQNAPQRVPAYDVEGGAQGKMPPVFPKKKRNWGKIAASVGGAVLVFLCGVLTCWFSLDKEIRTLLRVKDKIQEDYYERVSDDDFYKAVFDGINEYLLDDYSEYMTADEYAQNVKDLAGNRSGIGLFFTDGKNEKFRVSRVGGNSPAESAGVTVGERVKAYGKTEGTLVSVSCFSEFSKGIADYAKGEDFLIRVESKSGEERLVSVAKAQYVENYVFYQTKSHGYVFTGERANVLTKKEGGMSALNDDTAYIRLVQFTGNAAGGFGVVMEKFKEEGKKNLVLDLRGNGGGYLDMMQYIAGYFCKNATEQKPVVAIADFGGSKQRYRAYGNVYKEYFQEDGRIVVLADSDTASASECLIGCMVDYGAITYGDICLAYRGGKAKTYGKGIMQETSYVDIFEKDALKLTTAKILWPLSDTCIHGVGVLPSDGALTVAEHLDYEEETAAALKILFG